MIIAPDVGKTHIRFMMVDINLGWVPSGDRHLPSDADRARWSGRMDRYFENLKRQVREQGARWFAEV